MESTREKSVEEILVQCQERLHALLLCLCAAPEDVDDLLQQTNLEILRHAEEYDTSRPAFPWFRKFAILTVFNCRRKNRPDRILFDNDLLEKLAGVETEPTPPQRSEKLEECLAKLPLWQRRLIEERHVQGEELSGLATRMRITSTALSKMLWKIRDALRRCILKKEKQELSPDAQFLREMEQVFDGKANRKTQEHFIHSLQHSSQLRQLYREQVEIVSMLLRNKRTARKRKLHIAPIGIAASLCAFFAFGTILYKKPAATLPGKSHFDKPLEQENSMKTNTIVPTIALTALPIFADTLIWNGAENGTWDKSQENWLAGEEVSAWKDGSNAKFSQKASVTLDGEISASGIANADELSLSGGNLSLVDGATLELAGALSVSSKLKSEGALNITSVPQLKYSGFLQSNSSILIYPGGTLAQIKGAHAQMGGSQIRQGKETLPATMYHYKYSGTKGVGQFQAKNGTLLLCVRVEFTENAEGVWARSVSACYQYDLAMGTDADAVQMNSNGVATSLTTFGYGVSEISLTCEPVLAVNGAAEFGGEFALSGDALTIRAEGEAETFTHPNFLTLSANATTFTNMILANVEVLSGTMSGKSINSGNKPEQASVYHGTFDGQTYTCQFQFGNNNWTKGIKAELKQVDGNISARVIKSYYYPVGKSLGVDLDNTSGVQTQPVADSHTTAGYGLATMTLRAKKTPSIKVGTNNTCTDITADGAQMIFLTADALPQGTFSAINGAQVLFAGASKFAPVAGYGAEMYFGPGCTAVCTANLNTKGLIHYIFDGATLYTPTQHGRTKDGQNYFNRLTLKNGAKVIGNPLRIGYSPNVLNMNLNSEGEELNVLAAGINLANNSTGVSNNKLLIKTTADLSIPGTIYDYQDANEDLRGAEIVKRGDATLILSGKNTFCGQMTIEEGTVRIASATAFPADTPLALAGGTLECGNNTITAGALTLTGNSAIVLQEGNIAFADSSSAEWDSNAKLAITGNESLPTKTVRFGTSATALTAAQIRQITYNGEAIALDAEGYLKKKPTGTIVYLLN